MDWIPLFALPYWQKALAWWHSLGSDGPYYVWLAAGAVGALIWIWFAHRVIRKILGHRKYRGSWLNEPEYAKVMQVLQDAEREGRILQYQDAFALDAYRTGKHSSLRKHWHKGNSSV